MSVNYADSGRGWYCDSRYFKNHIGVLATINGQDYRKRKEGACICVSAYNSTNGNTGVIVISDTLEDATYQTVAGTSQAHSSFTYEGFTWYISTFSYWQIGQYSDTSGKSVFITVEGTNYTAIGRYVLSLASIQSEENFRRHLKRINYTGNSKVIKRLCQIINGLEDRFMKIEVYDSDNNGIVDNSEKVNNHTVYSDVPSDAVFTDTIYDDTEIRTDIRQLQNNVMLLLNEIFTSDFDYLVDQDGNYIVDQDGYKIIVGYYDSKYAGIMERIAALENKKYLVWEDAQDDE